MYVILHMCCQIQHTSARLHTVKTAPGEIQRDCSFGYWCLHIRMKVSPHVCRNIGHTMRVIFHIWCQVQCTSYGLCYVKSGPSQIQRSCSFVYSGLSIQTDVSPILLHIWLQLEARYTPNLQPNTVHVIPFDACEIGTQPNPAYLQFCIFSIKYSN